MAKNNTQKNFIKNIKPDWCAGCGNFIILNALNKAFQELDLKSYETLVISGIGCSGKLSRFLNTYAIEAIHGRALAVATGARLANKKAKIIVVAGDGDTYGIGLSHFINSIRRDLDITLLVHNNKRYSLTKGQASPTTEIKTITSTTPFGNELRPFDYLNATISQGCNFVAQESTFKLESLKEIIKEAINHKGFSFINVEQYCPTFNKKEEISIFNKTYTNLKELKNYKSNNRIKVLNYINENKNKFLAGIIFKN